MDSTEDVLSEQPWGKSYVERRSGWNDSSKYWWHKSNPHYETFNAHFQLIKDNKRGYWKRADIVRFETGYNAYYFHRDSSWKEWFMEKDDYLNSIHNHPQSHFHGKVPMYARLEFAMILSRYKWIKVKRERIYQDYGSIILMLTGSKAGHIRKYYARTPFMFVTRYPYDHIMQYWKERNVTEPPELSRIHEAMNYSDNREQFILNMISSYQDENYPMNMEEKNDPSTDFRIVRKRT